MAAAVCMLLFVCFCVSLSEQTLTPLPHDYAHTIYVDPTNPNSTNDSSCYSSASEQHPCGDINVALAFPLKTNSTKFVLSSTTTHYLANHSSTTVFIDGSQVAFYGDRDNGTAVVKCTEGAGLAFLNSSDITINRVSFQYCGAWRDSTSVDFSTNTLKLKQIRVGLYFYNCRDVTMVSMSVLNSTEALGVVMYSTVGVNNITHSQFNGNRISESNMEDSGGGGFAVEFNYCKPGDSNCSDQNHQTEGNSNAVYIFEHCSFIYNLGKDQSNGNGSGLFILPRNEIHSSLGRGGGLSLYFKGTAMNNTINITYCDFRRNHANWGGGLLAEFNDNSIQNLVNVLDSTFTENHCYFGDMSQGTAGGGVRVSSSVYYNAKFDKLFLRNFVFLQGCIFEHNKALSGGGLSLSFHFQHLSHKHQVFQANVSDSLFEFNSARLGSAVSVEHDHFYSTGDLGDTFFKECVFFNNSVLYVDPKKPYSVGIGALYISEVMATFEGYVSFEDNNGTALAIAGTTVNFLDGTLINFYRNFGARGGAISLLGMARLVISKGTNLHFTNNTAVLYGGAIFNNYIGKEDLRSSVKCFIQYSDPFTSPKQWQAKFVFSRNTAGKLGDSIYSTTILPCSWAEDLQADLDIVKEIFCWNSSIWIYENSTCADQIYTYAQSFDTSNHTRVVFPGHPFHMNIAAFDDLGHDVTSETVYTAVTKETSTSKVDPKYAFIADGFVGITGEEDQDVTLELDVAGFRDWHLHVNLTMEKCPPGFNAHLPAINISSNNKIAGSAAKVTCECIGGKELYTYGGNLFCDKSKLVSMIRNSYWIGLVPAIGGNKTLLMGSTVLLVKYVADDLLPLPQQHEDLDHQQCSYLNRTGPLCGECRKGYSTAVNSPSFECVPCTSNTTNMGLNIFAYVSLTYIPYLVVFLLIIIFDVRLMSAPAVGFILYAQLVGTDVFDFNLASVPYMKAGQDIPHKIQRAFQIVYGVFNLNSFSWVLDPFCVNKNFSALDVICLDFAIAAFPLLLIILIRLLMPLKSIRLRQKRKGIRDTTSAAAIQSINRVGGRALIHPFVSFIYLSYTKFSLASTKLLSTTGVFSENGSYLSNTRLIYYAGQYYFGQGDYIWPYGLIAILVSIFFATLLPLLLLGPFQFVNWLADKPRFHFINRFWPTLKINIFLDAFQSCYKPNRRYFAGIYFLFRLITFILYAFTPSVFTNLFWQQILCSVMIVLLAFLQPYKVRFFNYLDILIFLNLATINSISTYLYTSHVERLRSDYSINVYVSGVILAWLPLVYILMYLCWLALRKTHLYEIIIRCLEPLMKHLYPLFSSEDDPERRPLISPAARGRMTEVDIEPSSLTDSGLFRRAEESIQQTPRKKTVGKTDVSAHGTSGTADFNGTNITGSSGIMSGGSDFSNTRSSKSTSVQVTDTD